MKRVRMLAFKFNNAMKLCVRSRTQGEEIRKGAEQQP
jgi:hypothetical protein